MTKAERRKRARARAREREQAAVAPDALEKAVEAVKVAPEPTRTEPESEFITGPVRAKPAPRTAATRLDLPGRVQAPLDEEVEGEDEDDDEEVDEDDLIEGSDDGDGGEDEDEDEDEDLEEQEDALFNLACAALEQGDALSWQEAAALLLTAEVLDPRLALVVALLMEGALESETADKHVPLALTGERVLRLLAELGLGDLVDEAREVTSLAPGEEVSGQERELVRTSARALNELSKRELTEGKKGERGKKASGRPLRASDVGARTILSSGATQRRPG